MSKLAELWTSEIRAGRKTIEDVPYGLKKEVTKLLEANDEPLPEYPATNTEEEN